MQYSTGKIAGGLNAGGMEFEKGSVYDCFCQLTDLRGVNGKRYELEAILTIVLLAKLCGQDKPMGIAEWAKHRKEELVKLFCLNWSSMPHQNTYWRIMAYKVYEQEVACVVGAYNQRGVHGNKTTHGLRHTAISSAIRHHAPAERVRGMSRHASLDTLMIYYHEKDRIDDSAEKYISYGYRDRAYCERTDRPSQVRTFGIALLADKSK